MHHLHTECTHLPQTTKIPNPYNAFQCWCYFLRRYPNIRDMNDGPLKKKKKGGNRFPLKAFSTDVEFEPNINPAHRLSAVKHMFPRSYLWWEIKILTCNMC